jgi:hypothetical protein
VLGVPMFRAVAFGAFIGVACCTAGFVAGAWFTFAALHEQHQAAVDRHRDHEIEELDRALDGLLPPAITGKDAHEPRR